MTKWADELINEYIDNKALSELQVELHDGAPEKEKSFLESIEIIPDITEQLDMKIREAPIHLTSEEKEIIINAIGSCSLRERQCYLMHLVGGHSMKKIADVLGIAKGTAQQYINRARKKVEAAKEK